MATLLELEKQIKNGEPIRMNHWLDYENIRFESSCGEFVTEAGDKYNIRVRDMFSDNWEVVSKEMSYIGCLCKFWDYDISSYCIGVLRKIENESSLKYVTHQGTSWLHCAPMKPEEVKFYQGE